MHKERWQIEIRAASAGDATLLEASVVSSTERRRTTLPLIGKLIDDFTCRLEGQALSNRAQRIDDSKLIDFFDTTLRTTARRLPLVGVSESADGETALDPDALQRLLAGTAHVAVWDSDLSYRIVRELGRHCACYNGAVRIYRPRPNRADDRERHPFLLSSRAKQAGFAQELLELVVGEALELDPPTQISQIIGRIRESDRLAKALQQPRQEIERLQQENAELKERNNRLSSQLDQAVHYMAGEMSDFPASDAGDPKSVAEAVQLAENECEHLDMFRTVAEEARHSRYSQPDKVLGALRALNALAGRLVYGATSEAQIVNWLRETGIQVSTESEDTMRRFGDQRLFRNEFGQPVSMPMHVKLGGGRGQGNHCRIHFAWNALSSKIGVGHVGRHLQTSQS